ncbi:MAG TPA: hypothetical protein VIM07_12825, partial [Chitinophagaceae bacterium]
MKKIFILLTVCLLVFKSSIAQDSVNVVNHVSHSTKASVITDKETLRYPYKTSFKTDAPIIAVGLGLTYLGNTLIKNEKPLTVAELANETKDKVPFFDRGNVGFYSDKINKASYIPMLGS